MQMFFFLVENTETNKFLSNQFLLTSHDGQWDVKSNSFQGGVVTKKTLNNLCFVDNE